MAGTHSFSFDRVFGPMVRQVDVFNEVAKPIVEGIEKIFTTNYRSPKWFQWDCFLLWLDGFRQDFHNGSKLYNSPLTF